jgi:hypothetical protein
VNWQTFQIILALEFPVDLTPSEATMKCSNCHTTLALSGFCLECGLSFSNADWLLDEQEDPSHHTSKLQKIHRGFSALKEIRPFTWFHAGLLKIVHSRNNVRRCSARPWNPVSLNEMLIVTGGFLTMFYLLSTKSMLGDDSFILDMLHNVNLVFHEAGHWIFALSGNIMIAILGGSLNQILIPLIVTSAFWLNRDTVGYTFGLFWCFENFLDVAYYIADARALELPLLGELGKDGHDWHILLTHLDLLHQDISIAGYCRVVGWLGMLATWIWLLNRWKLDNAHSKNNQ